MLRFKCCSTNLEQMSKYKNPFHVSISVSHTQDHCDRGRCALCRPNGKCCTVIYVQTRFKTKQFLLQIINSLPAQSGRFYHYAHTFEHSLLCTFVMKECCKWTDTDLYRCILHHLPRKHVLTLVPNVSKQQIQK